MINRPKVKNCEFIYLPSMIFLRCHHQKQFHNLRCQWEDFLRLCSKHLVRLYPKECNHYIPNHVQNIYKCYCTHCCNNTDKVRCLECHELCLLLYCGPHGNYLQLLQNIHKDLKYIFWIRLPIHFILLAYKLATL